MLAVSQKKPRRVVAPGRAISENAWRVQGVYVLGQGAHGDVINAGFGKFADGFKRHVAGYFQRRLAVGSASPLHASGRW